ncbi:hypothetical protein [Streptomyces silaceus]|uniref:hypothetical protein n=1 Tax=Streptomyces silaceus TaxID=545123 RepID=UPI0006EB411A|nr:hypothetical protein [Streptomyces silaceus]
MRDASVLAACLSRLGWSPERLAREINHVCGPGTISEKAPYNWLRGSCPRRQLPHVVARILSARLSEGISVEALWPRHFSSGSRAAGPAPSPRPGGRPREPSVTGEALVSGAVDWLVADEVTAPLRTHGEELSPVDVEMLSTRIRQLRRMDDDRGGRVVLDWTVQDLRWAQRLAGEYAYDAGVGVRLHGAIAELGQLAGWLAADVGLEADSRRHFLEALRAARSAGDRELGAYIVSCMSYRALWSGQGHDALRLIRMARKGTAGAPAGIRQALLATREARAHAAVGDQTSCQHHLEQAAELSQGGGDDGMPWAYWLTPAVMVADAGRAWLELGRPDRAEWHLQCGLEMLGGTQPRNRLLHSASLADARLARDELDGAAEAVMAALDLAENLTSLRARVRLSGLRRRLLLHQDSASARQILERMEYVLGPSGLRCAS